MKALRVAIVGQPNVGKSCVLNALVGSRIIVSNYPGTSVEVTRGKKVVNDTRIEFQDTPGIYSLSAGSEDERITARVLFEGRIDAAIVIADSTSLHRSLYLALQILEAQVPLVMACNFVEDARKRGIGVDYARLGTILHVPVIPINPLKKRGMADLIDAVLRYRNVGADVFDVEYDDHIEKAIERLGPHIRPAVLPARFVALRVLEGDTGFRRYLQDEARIEQALEGLGNHPRGSQDIPVTRYGIASFIADMVTRIAPSQARIRLRDRVDSVLLGNISGMATTAGSLLALFGALLYLGNLMQGVFMGFTETLLTSFSTPGPSIVRMVLSNALTGFAAGVSIALPYVFLFYVLLALLEDIGLLPRFIVNLERFFKALGLPGKAFVPLALGLGCTAPATTATRVLSSKEDQFHTAALFPFVPCSSRIAIIMGVVGYFAGVALAFSVFATLVIAGLLWAFVIKKATHRESEPLLLELPVYRKPLMANVVAKSWIRMKDFVYIVIPFLIVGGIAYGVLDTLGLTSAVVRPLSPITAWLGLPPVAIIPLVFGFLQKDLTGAMLVSVFGTGVASVLSPMQIYTFGVAATIGIPCIIALGMLVRELGFKEATLLTMGSIGYGLLCAGVVWRASLIV